MDLVPRPSKRPNPGYPHHPMPRPNHYTSDMLREDPFSGSYTYKRKRALSDSIPAVPEPDLNPKTEPNSSVNASAGMHNSWRMKAQRLPGKLLIVIVGPIKL